MDNQKDNQNSLEIVKFVEGSTARTNPFGDNRVGERAYKRCERIAAALTLLTNHVDEREALRYEVRAKTLTLLSCVLSVRNEMRAVNSERVQVLKSTVRELISLVRLLAVAGFISFQNASTVSEALDEISTFLIASQRSGLSESINFSREDFLDVREKGRIQSNREYKMSDNSIKDNMVIKDRQIAASATTTDTGVTHDGASEQNGSLVRSARAQAIREVLQQHGALGIRDIASSLPEYSEKMIQRELVDLVLAGHVRKTGSKRWSMYVLGEPSRT